MARTRMAISFLMLLTGGMAMAGTPGTEFFQQPEWDLRNLGPMDDRPARALAGAPGEVITSSPAGLRLLPRTLAAVPLDLRVDGEPVSVATATTWLYAAMADGRVSRHDLTRPFAAAVPVKLVPRPRGRVLLAVVADHLMVAESGYGLRFLAFSKAHHVDEAPGLHESAVYPLEGQIGAVGAYGNQVAVASESRVWWFDASSPETLDLLVQAELPAAVNAVALDAENLYVAGADGALRIGRRNGNSVDWRAVFPAQADALLVEGRDVLLGTSGGTVRLNNGSSVMATINVSITNFAFSPNPANCNTGDTIRWTNNASPTAHNSTRSSAPETWSSGNLAPGASFSRVFNVAGTYGYVCTLHVSMNNGSVVVAAPPSPPPGAGTGMTAVKQVADGSSIQLTFDTATCTGDADYHILYGTPANLPTALGGAYGTAGGQCDIGTTGSYTWANALVPAADSFYWFIVVADNNGTTEGPWGKDSQPAERNGATASSRCTCTTKDTTSSCG